MKKILTKAIFALLMAAPMTAMAGNIDESIYRNLPFKMQHIAETSFANYSVNIQDMGAQNGGKMLCTDAINAAIKKVNAAGGGHVIVPSGLWLTGPIVLLSNVDLHLETGAVVVFSDDMKLYPIIETNYEGLKAMRCQSPLTANNAENIAITGEGVFDGQGDGWRPVKKGKMSDGQWRQIIGRGGTLSEDGSVWMPSADHGKYRPNLLKFINCKRVLLEDATFKNSPCWCLHPLMCDDLVLRRVKVMNPWYGQNGDALDAESCSRVLIDDCMFDAGDDGICMKSGKDAEGRKRAMPTQDVIVRNTSVMHGHGGFVIGSEMSGGVRNVYLDNCSFIGTDNGLRFKSTRGRGGLVDNIYINNVNMLDITGAALTMDLYYWVDKNSKQPTTPVFDVTTPTFKNIHMTNVFCKGAGKAIHINGLPESPLSDITIDNMVVTDAAAGVYVNDAKDIKMTRVSVESKADQLKTGRVKNVTLNGKTL